MEVALMSNCQILASIIIPVYNVELYLKECLDSIFVNQGISLKFEVIIINDGSTDDSLNILNEYKIRHDFILINQNNQGIGAARNKGIKAAKGKYLIFADSDDYFVPYALDKLLEYLAAADAEIIEYDYDVLYCTESNFKKNNNISVVSGTGQDVFCEWRKTGFYHSMVWTRAIARSLIVSNHLFFSSNRCCEDVEWSPRVFAYAQSVLYFSHTIYTYRIRENSASTADYDPKKRVECIDALVSLYKFSFTDNLSEKYVKTLREKIFSFYLSFIKEIKFGGEYNDSLIFVLEKHSYFMKYADSFHRRYFYRYFIDIFGLKKFYGLKYNRKHTCPR